MRLTLFGLAAIVIIGAVVVFVGPLFISTDDLRDSLFAQVETATGYRLRVSGPVQILLFPSLDLVAEDVGLARSGEGDASEMARAKTLRFGLQLSALLGGKVKMTEVTLIDPVIAMPATQADARVKEGKQEGSTPSSAVAALKTLSLDKLLIKNGAVILHGSNGTPGQRIEALDLEASLPDGDAALSFALKAVIDGRSLGAAGSIGSFGQFLDGGAAPVALRLDAPSYLDEAAALNGTAVYDGIGFTLSQFTAKAGGKSLRGSASYRGNLLTLHPFTVEASGNTLSGSLVADLSGAVPAVNLAMSGERLDLDAFLSNPGGTAASPAAANAAAGWSDANIDFSGLRAVTAKLKVTTGELTYNGVKIGNVMLQATMAGGKLSATLPKFALYGGAGSASLDVDASGKVPAQRVKLSLANFNAYPFLDSAGFESLEGTGAVTLDLAASGASQRAIVSALGGTAKIEFTDGAIRGINIAKTVRNLSTGILSGWQENAAEKTDFATLGASFKIAQGQAQTSDLRLAGPLVRLSGAGTIALPAQTLKFRVDPKLVASLEGQGGNADLQGLGVPVMIAGPWARPSIYPDIEGILSDPAAAYEQLRRIGGGLVSLPGAETTGSVDAIGALIKNGKTDTLGQNALTGIGQLLGGQQSAGSEPVPAHAEQQAPAAEGVTQAKKSKKRQGDANADTQAAPAQAPAPKAAKQVLQSLFGN